MGYSKFLIRTVVSVSLMIWLLSKVDLSQIGDQWQEINWLLLVFVIPPIHMLCIALRSLRLKMILSGMGLGISVSWLSLAQLKSLFVGAILPGGISGDVYRSYLVSKTTGQAFESIAAVLVEKCVGIGSMLFMFIVGLFWGSVFVGHPVFVDLERSLRFIWVGLLLAAIIFCATLFYSGQAQRAGTPFNYTGKLRACLSHVLGFFATAKTPLRWQSFPF